MKHSNRSFFRHIYPGRWLAGRQIRTSNTTHYQYQEITLASLACFDGCSLLECGCGSGELLARLYDRYPRMRLFGIDLGRDSMLWAKRGPLLTSDVRFIEGDITTLPIESSRFDRVLCSSVLWYVTEPYTVIQEMVRVLKPGGRFVFDVRPPYHITNVLTKCSLVVRRLAGQTAPSYSFLSLRALSQCLEMLPVKFDIVGYFVLLPTRLPLLSSRWGNWTGLSYWLSFKAGHGQARWLAQKLLITGHKLVDCAERKIY